MAKEQLVGWRWVRVGDGGVLSVRFHFKLRLRQGRDEDLGQLAALMILPDGLALLGHLDEVDVLRRASRGCGACRACKRRHAVRTLTRTRTRTRTRTPTPTLTLTLTLTPTPTLTLTRSCGGAGR